MYPCESKKPMLVIADARILMTRYVPFTIGISMT